jgi:hypothetical protein
VTGIAGIGLIVAPIQEATTSGASAGPSTEGETDRG